MDGKPAFLAMLMEILMTSPDKGPRNSPERMAERPFEQGPDFHQICQVDRDARIPPTLQKCVRLLAPALDAYI